YVFFTDKCGRIGFVDVDLVLGKGVRNLYAQRTVGGEFRLLGDDGGHLVGSQFNGSGQIDNLVPQSSIINRAGGDWYKLEREWASALRDNKIVKFKIKLNYSQGSLRPDSFVVEYFIDNIFYYETIENYK
ncbi:MAG: DNA/RNA non-specific endonuclease, partial [Bacilli bacterium]